MPDSIPEPVRAIAIEMANSQIRACLLVEQKEGLLNWYTDPKDLGERPDVDTTLQRIRTAADKVREDAGLGWSDISGVGVTIPNPINKHGVIAQETMLKGWGGLNLRRKMQDQFPELKSRQANIVIYNDQHAVALAELAYGEAQGRPTIDLVAFIVTAGIGAGIVINGKLLIGETGLAGEVGHIVIDPSSADKCAGCGQAGCLEMVSSGNAMAAKAGKLIARGGGKNLFETVLLRTTEEQKGERDIVDDGGGYYDFQNDLIGGGRTYRIWAREVIAAAKAGDKEAIQIVEEAGRGLGKAVVMLLHTLNPAMIVVGGVIGRAGPIYLIPAEDWVNGNAMRAARVKAPILSSNLEDFGPLYGAAAGVFASAKGLPY